MSKFFKSVGAFLARSSDAAVDGGKLAGKGALVVGGVALGAASLSGRGVVASGKFVGNVALGAIDSIADAGRDLAEGWREHKSGVVIDSAPAKPESKAKAKADVEDVVARPVVEPEVEPAHEAAAPSIDIDALKAELLAELMAGLRASMQAEAEPAPESEVRVKRQPAAKPKPAAARAAKAKA